jgi:hypothetical protein
MSGWPLRRSSARTLLGVIYADPPWHFKTWDKHQWWGAIGMNTSRHAAHITTRCHTDIMELPVSETAPDCALFLWVVWPTL